jgi:class 3 adenylate cyclase/predicted ATPase
MQQIADWLEKLGLGQYTQRFAENEIDVTVLRHLTDQDLREIGVPLGHRRKILAAIREGVGSPAPFASEPVGHLEPTSQASAERRQITVMFSDLVGSTALSARMDPEDLREVISAYQKCVAEIVRRFGGFVAKYMGDGVLVYFGYPEAHDDDTERAVRAGLELVAAVRALKTPASLQSRVGIATGLVVVGDLIGSGSAQEQAIVGETPNLAARLQGIAEPNTVVIAESTRRLLGDLFELEDVEVKDLKGIAGPVRAWMALRPGAVESRFEAFRPDFEPPWIGRPHVTAVTLNRLTQREVGAIIDRVVGNKLLPANIRRDIVERSDGIPLFIEEMTKAVLEAESRSTAEQMVGAIPFSGRAVPASLHASLMARLDRLGPAKEVAQLGAAIGREFSHALLSAVLRKPSAELGSALERLIASGLLFRQGVLPHATYLFKHALVQDAAYGTLLREQRRALHARVADTLEVQFADTAESQPELLARHCTEAGLIEKAASLWGKAGQRSLARSALVEAAEQLTRALGQLGSLPATSISRREQIKLQVALINSLFHVKGYAAPETKAAVEQARLLIEQAKALGEAPEDPLQLFSVLYGLWVANLVAFDRDVCIDLATEFLSLAEKEGTAGPLMVGHQMLGISLQTGGDITGGRDHYDQAIALYEPVEHRPLATRFGQDSRVVVLSRRSAALWLLGYPDAAFADAEHALTHAREIGHAASLMYTLGHGLFARYECGNYANATAAVDELIALAEKKSTLFWKGFGLMHQGCLCALNAQPSEAVRLITSGMDTRELTGATLWIPFFFSHLARAYTALGNFEDARRSIREAMMTIERIKETWCEAEVHRTAGEIMLRAPERDAAKAEAYFNHALTVAHGQEAKTWELRAAMSMARLWRNQGKPQQARELLAPIYGWFTEGFDTRDLKDAKALLEQLAS